MDAYEIKKIMPADKSKTGDFLHIAFYPHCPALTSMNVTEIHPFHNAKLLDIIDEGFSYAAISRDGKILGVLLSSEFSKKNPDDGREQRENCTIEYYQKLRKFQESMEKDAKILEIGQCDKGLEFRIAAVLPMARKQGLMKRLFQFTIEIAKQSDYKLLLCHCASQYVADLCQALGWNCVYCLPYISYEQDGERVFKNPVHPHLYSRIYVKYL